MNKTLLTIPLVALAIACENPEPETITVEVEVERDCITGVNLTPIQNLSYFDEDTGEVSPFYGSEFEVSLCDEYYMAADIEITYGNYDGEMKGFKLRSIAEFGPDYFTYSPLVDFEPSFIEVTATYTNCLPLLEGDDDRCHEDAEVWTEYNYIEIR